ncbi:MAG TPA: dihydrolipoamide acetyltransferase family protein [Verrucomicrobiae bacterium]|nr:dihydrolipoamide acetyltransferase family protein [Verrucomicrobiae bacterium]
MPTEITMPKLSDTMTEGKLVSWKKSTGERVERGDIIAEVETDKANMELEAFSSGTLLETRAKPGDTVAVGTVIALIGEEGEKPAGQAAPVEAVPSPAEAPAEKKGEKEPGPAEETKSEAETRRETGLGELGEGVTAAAEPERAPAPQEPAEQPEKRPAGQPEAKPAERPEAKPAEQQAAPPAADRASPLVRRLAREKGVDLSRVSGSGPDGRVTVEDLERPAPAEEAAPPAAAQPEEGEQPLSRMRSAIARKVSATWKSTPHFSVTVEIDMGVTEQLYRGLKKAGRRITLNDFVIKACAAALPRFPLLRGAFSGESLTIRPQVDIGFAVSLPEGLLIPVVRGCDRLPLPKLARETRRLAEKARSGKLTADEMQGGVFTVSNLGMYGVDEFSAVINSPEAAILAVGQVADRAVVRDGTVTAARIMRATLSADHRIVDGAYAALFLQELRHNLENPAHIVIDEVP